MSRRFGATVIALMFLLIVPAAALAADDGVTPGDDLDLQLWGIVAGGLSPAVAYLLNRFWSTASEPVKGLIFAVTAAVAGALAELIDLGSIGFDQATLEYVLAAVITAFGAHIGFYKTTGLNVAIGSAVTAQRTDGRF